ncbi:MAG: 2-hydroxychromene-2-carboxylate isomerase [Alphaproteobacteria bacterium]|nr:2-hydroxychromene-2-carboxylate isomerase [Alphaproteobacteria bacterium]
MTLEIWFEFASTYSYLTVSRAEALLSSENLDFSWKPFLLGPIFREKGISNSPFVLDPVKGAHMWRDLERRSQHYGLPFVRPTIFPMNSLPAARIMIAAADEPWCGTFARAVFAAQFSRGDDISQENVLSEALKQSGADPEAWIERARDEQVKAKLRAQTAQALKNGVFGAPSFKVGDELFWGDDRLEDAIAWAHKANG